MIRTRPFILIITTLPTSAMTIIVLDDLLDQLGKSKYFSALDLAAGYWQVRVHSDSQEKTAFITHQGLYDFRVMPFGLCNAPAVFQRLMQRVIMGLNPEEGPDFVAVYLDGVLIFSETLEDHLRHVRIVIEQVMATGLKLKPVKCHFVRQEVEYLGHLITPDGLRHNSNRVAAVREFVTPRSVTEIRQFLGLASYYRCFIPKFAKIAQPLHQLTKKGAQFDWTSECQTAFKSELIQAPVLAYPTRILPWKPMPVSEDWVLFFRRPRVMAGLIRSLLPAEPYHLKKRIMGSPSWRHWPLCGPSVTSMHMCMYTKLLC